MRIGVFQEERSTKDENDLDCAVREVYEETGLNLQAAGLVKDEKEMKYIEQTMREQHMKLFVFKGVPLDTHFEPRTRKEISKIEWYKLTDLPTLKKHKHQDSNGGEHAGMSANKFYMVAPFLGQLKKWIAQEKKRDNRYSSNLAAPPILAEEAEIETHHSISRSHPLPSDLPEVTINRSAEATAQLKELFNIGGMRPAETQPQQVHSNSMPQVDTAKSNALLALLRGGPSAELRAGPHTPLDQMSFPPNQPASPHPSQVRSPHLQQQPPPQFHMQPELPTSRTPVQHQPRTRVQAQQPMPFRDQLQSIGLPLGQGPVLPVATSKAPYQQTGDPEFARPRLSSAAPPRVPPASALPKLTSQSRLLLDVFQGASSPAQQSKVRQPANAQQPSGSKQSLLDLFNQRPAPASLSPPSSLGAETSPLPAPTTSPRPRNSHQSNLLSLLSQPKSKATPVPVSEQEKPAELSATPDHEHRPGESKKKDLLLSLLRQQNDERSAHRPQAKLVKEGETAATINGPLNQPNFEAIVRSHKESSDTMGRSPLTTHRTLFDPNQPAPVKIMARPQTPKESEGKSPRAPKAKMSTASPKRNVKPTIKEQKPFQPQILKRPQMMEAQVSSSPVAAPTVATSGPVAMSRDVSSEKRKDAHAGAKVVSKRCAQADIAILVFWYSTTSFQGSTNTF